MLLSSNVMFRSYIAVAFFVLTATVASASLLDTGVKLINFAISGPDGFTGVWRFRRSLYQPLLLRKFGNAVRVMAYRRDSLPKNLNACFYVNSNVYGLTRIVQESDGSYLWQLEYLVDAGTAYSFTLHSDGTISGKGGFYGGVGLSKDLPNNKVSGTYKITGNLDECIGSFPDSNK
jgi:hypothetical protein